MRKLTATQVANDGASDEIVRNVATHMTHSADTARKYYQHLEGVAQSVEAYTEISRKRFAHEEQQEAIVVPKLKRRKMWLPEEEDVLNGHFDLWRTTKNHCVPVAKSFACNYNGLY